MYYPKKVFTHPLLLFLRIFEWLAFAIVKRIIHKDKRMYFIQVFHLQMVLYRRVYILLNMLSRMQLTT